MKKLLLSILLITGITASGYAQLIDDFSDGDFTNNPTWTGTTANWTIVANSSVAGGTTGSNTLRLNAPADFNGDGSGTSYLSTQRTATWGNEQSWGVWIGRRAQAATAANVTYIWLYASEANVTSPTVDGYRIKFGDDSGGDEIYLEKVTDGVPTTIITSSSAVTNGLTNIGFQIRITRSLGGTWNLFSSALPTTNGTGANAAATLTSATTSNNLGSAVDNTYTNFSNGYFSIAATHSGSASPRAGLEVDNFKFDTSESATLPVSLTSFTAKAYLQNIDLAWATASESNNSHFEILRSGDGKSFSKIGNINGAGTSNTPKSYIFTDKDALPGVSYYQLKQVDADGKSAESEIVAVKSNVAASNFSVFANKQEGTVRLTIFAANEGKGSIKIYDLNGRKLTEQQLSLHKGYTNVSVPFSGANGLHVASLTTASETVTQKFIQ